MRSCDELLRREEVGRERVGGSADAQVRIIYVGASGRSVVTRRGGGDGDVSRDNKERSFRQQKTSTILIYSPLHLTVLRL